jgi:ubiquinone/menaquinone biosynthesis C-methylase UbiE
MSPSRIERQRRDWEEVAGFNPEWGVLTDGSAKRAGWDIDPFMASGEVQIAGTMEIADALGLPRERGSVLDFGCGVGRLARPLSERFGSYTGVDISDGMLRRARELNGEEEGRRFVLNEREDLGQFRDDGFDAVVSFLVLQHLAEPELILGYLREFARVLKPGGLIAVQLVTHVPPIYRLRVRRRLYRVARALGVSVDRAHRWGLQSMAITAVPARDVRSLFEGAGCEVRREVAETAQQGVGSATFYATKP